MATAAETTPVPAHDGIVVGEPPIVDITALRKSYGSNGCSRELTSRCSAAR